MIRPHYPLLTLLLCGLGLFAGYRIVAMAQADYRARSHPTDALRWMPRHPQGLLALAERQLDEGRIQQAEVTARRLLAVEPLEGRGFRILAEAAMRQGRCASGIALYKIAARRSPRDMRTLAWLTEYLLVAGHYAAALELIDRILRLSPKQHDTVLPILVRLASDPAFAQELVRLLKRRPQWREAFLSKLRSDPAARTTTTVMSMLQEASALTRDESEAWLKLLMDQGRWDEAYGLWVQSVITAAEPLSPVYNGRLERSVTGRGFDWSLRRTPGVTVRLGAAPGAQGRAAHLAFAGRPVARVNMEQPLLLAPGAYDFSARVRAQALRSEQGLAWTLTCNGRASPFAVSEPLKNSFSWRIVSMPVEVPATGCNGQWLRLETAGAVAVPDPISGDLWFDDVFMRGRARNNAGHSGTDSTGLRFALRVHKNTVLVSRGDAFVAVRPGTDLRAGNRILLTGAAAATVSSEQCQQAYNAPGVYTINPDCAAPYTSDGTQRNPASSSAAAIAAHLRVNQTIVRNIDTRVPIPAGR